MEKLKIQCHKYRDIEFLSKNMLYWKNDFCWGI